MQIVEVREPSRRVDPPPEALSLLLRHMPLRSRLSRAGRLTRRMLRQGIRHGRPVSVVMNEINDAIAMVEGSRLVTCIECDAVLLGDEWRGRAIVRCGACGTRNGVEVPDADQQTVWSLDVPAD